MRLKSKSEHRKKKSVTTARHSFPVIAIAASEGGLKALSVILSGLPADFPAAIAIVMHLSPDHESILAEILDSRSQLEVRQAKSGDFLCHSCVFVAPPNHHLSVAKGGHLKLSSSSAEKVNYARPSAEPLFVSVAKVYKKQSIAVVLTGGDGDGSFGVQIIKDNGGMVIAQDRPTSKNFSMPETSINTGDVDFILPLDRIGPKLIEMVERGVHAASPRVRPKSSKLAAHARTHISDGRSSVLKGHGDKDSPTLKGLKHRSQAARSRKIPARAATPSGLKKNTFALTQGSSPTRNPRLKDGIPSGFKQAAKNAGKVKRAPRRHAPSHSRATPRYPATTKAARVMRTN